MNHKVSGDTRQDNSPGFGQRMKAALVWVAGLALSFPMITVLRPITCNAQEPRLEEAQAGTIESPETRPPKKLRGLIVTGGCCHDYLRQTTILTTELSRRANVSWTVIETGSQRDIRVPIYQQEDWAEEYDVVVHNECFGGVTDVQFVDNIVAEHVRSGVPAVVIHCSMHSYRNANTDRWRRFVGMTSRRHERSKRSLKVVPNDKQHPIMLDFPEHWDTPNGELYIIENVWPGASVLATAYSKEEEADQPVIWTNELDGVRVFGTTLGHHNETMQHSVWLDTTARGLLWACDKLSADGQPKAGYGASGSPGPVFDAAVVPGAARNGQRATSGESPTPAPVPREK